MKSRPMVHGIKVPPLILEALKVEIALPDYKPLSHKEKQWESFMNSIVEVLIREEDISHILNMIENMMAKITSLAEELSECSTMSRELEYWSRIHVLLDQATMRLAEWGLLEIEDFLTLTVNLAEIAGFVKSYYEESLVSYELWKLLITSLLLYRALYELHMRGQLDMRRMATIVSEIADDIEDAFTT